MIISRALVDLAEFLRLPQEASGRGRVVLDRRVSERRRVANPVEQDRRRSDRRRSPATSTEALMRVLGFMIVPAGSPNGSGGRRRASSPATASPGPARPAPRRGRA